jgi:hypothetical protein
MVRGFNHHYERMCQQVAGEGHSLQIWTEAESTLNKQLQTADKR